MDPWTDKAFARQHWPDAPADDTRLDDLLEVATEQCAAYAPLLVAGTPIPTSYALAVVYQAREVYTAAQRGDVSTDVIGVGDYAIRARPLSSVVKQLLRPQRRIGSVG